MNNVYDDGILLTLDFRINPNAEEGLAEITINVIDIINDKFTLVAYQSQNGGINITSSRPLDFNNDGVVNPADTLLLRRYIAGWNLPNLPGLNYPINRAASVDGNINPGTTLLLRRYIAGWDVFQPQAAMGIAAFGTIASEPMQLSILDVAQAPGGRADMVISLDNNPGIYSIMFDVLYDARLTLVGFTVGNILSVPVPPQNIAANPVRLVFEATGMNNAYGEGALITLHFDIAEDAQLGAAHVSLHGIGVWDENFGTPMTNASNGYVIIEIEEPEPPIYHTIKIIGGGYGTTASPNKATEGTTVTLYAGSTPTGYTFAYWASADVTITNASSATNATFTMPNHAAVVTANWEAEECEDCEEPDVINRTALSYEISRAEERMQADYTPASFMLLGMQLPRARAVYNNANATQVQVDEAADQLRAAVDGLVPNLPPIVEDPARDTLNAVLADAESRIQVNYTPASWMSLMMEVPRARAVNNNMQSTQAQIDAAADNLQAAINALVLRP
jgi:hypothetical protein